MCEVRSVQCHLLSLSLSLTDLLYVSMTRNLVCQFVIQFEVIIQIAT